MITRILVLGTILLLGCAGRQGLDLGKKRPDTAPKVQYSGGSGDSYEDAVKISGVEKQSQGVDAEYKYISGKYGQKGKDWQLKGQTIVKEGEGAYDVLEIKLLNSSEERIYYFDVSSFPWKKNKE